MIKEQEEKTKYTLTPKLPKSMYDEEIWSNTLKNGKNVNIIIISFWRWCEFGISLSKSEYKSIKKSKNIIVSDYDYEFYNSDDCRCKETLIENKDKYSDEELEEINELMGDEDCCDEDTLDENGWISGDVKYVITDGFELVEED